MSLRPKPVNFDEKWTALADSLERVITLKGLDKVSWMSIYHDVYDCCTAQPQPHSEALYNKLQEWLKAHVSKLLAKISSVEIGETFLAEHQSQWITYTAGATFAHGQFRYLNANWIKKTAEQTRPGGFVGLIQQASDSSPSVVDVRTLSLLVWKDTVFVQLKDRLLTEVLKLIEKERDGEVGEVGRQELIKGIIDSFIRLGIHKGKALEVYNEHFEGAFITETTEYYARESAAFVAANGVAAYLKKAETRVNEETERGVRYLDGSSHDKLREAINAVLVEKHKDLLQAECEPYLKQEKLDDLRRMYHLLSRIDKGIDPMLEELEKYVTAWGMEAVASIPKDQAKDPKVYVEKLLGVYKKFAQIVKAAFSNDPAFVASLDKACRKIVNENRKSPELLAKYCDFLLKKGQKNLAEEEVEGALADVITIFKYVDDKDVFQKFYSKMLAKRLIHATSASSDAESSMISRLKQSCGYEYTSKLQRMFTDVSISSDLQEKFFDHIGDKAKIGNLDFSILVLTAGSWPMQANPSPFQVPGELEKSVKHFAEFYDSQHQGRKLTWLHNLSKGDLRLNYLPKKYEVQATSFQMGVLLLFNAQDSHSFADIASATQLAEPELRRTLQSLIDTKLLVVAADGATAPAAPAAPSTSAGAAAAPATPAAPLSPTSTISLNMAFSSKRARLRIVAQVQAETPAENQETRKAIDDDRKLYLQAAIVRIMKARKTLRHNALIQEVISQARSRFTPSVPNIKKAIEQLIEKGYIERGEETKEVLVYVS